MEAVAGWATIDTGPTSDPRELSFVQSNPPMLPKGLWCLQDSNL